MRAAMIGLALVCLMSKAELIEENAIQIQTYQTEVANEAEEEEQAMHYYGNCRITFYCPASCCCGAYATGITASGAPVQANHTVASGDLPFGTRLMIDGQEYVVEDRGVGAQQIDIFVNSHQEALDRGLYYTDVYIIDG